MPGPVNIPKRPGLNIKSQNPSVVKPYSRAAQLTTLLKNKKVKKTLTTFATEVGQKIVKGGARLNLLAMMLSPSSAGKGSSVVDPVTGVNKFTGESTFTPLDFTKEN